MMSDQVEKIYNSLIQHGNCNDRVYLMKVSTQDVSAVIDYAQQLALAHGYSKIFAKVTVGQHTELLERGFTEEAVIPGLFSGRDAGSFMSLYRSQTRKIEQEKELVENVLVTAQRKALAIPIVPEIEVDFNWRIMEKKDCAAMACLYKEVFASYPFPISDPNYLLKTMNENVIYHGIWHGDALVALSSAEIDFEQKNVEMTDFATQPDYRGYGFANYLLSKMEQDVQRLGILTAYTIASAYSHAMNITFARHGYLFSGTLTNNTQIFGKLESMNVWYKPL